MVLRSEQGETRILHRDGWTRRESAWARGTSIQVNADNYLYNVSFTPEGATGLNLARGAFPTSPYRPSDQRDVVLGERCRVWLSEPTVHERVYGGPVLTCFTRDGIALWSGRLPPGGSAEIGSRMVSLERRAVAWSEVLPPREVLSWSYWAHHFPASPVDAMPAYETAGGGVVNRFHGELFAQSTRVGSFSLRNRNALMGYYVRQDRRTLTIQVSPQRPMPHPLTGGSEPLDRPPLHRFGETCRWHRIDLGVRWGIVSTCVTGDGISLANAVDFHDPANQDEYHEVRNFRRGPPTAASMRPPPDIFDPWIAALPQ
ncbi:MAG TPA: hypothetical protein VEF55_07220 [Candidatus Binatia bacterium]|nr:hypothetical protein [Candidatus Binatia bacterium]